MKELEITPSLSIQDNIELSVKKKQEIEYNLEGTIKPQRGHFIFELNENTGEIKKAEFKKIDVVFNAEVPLGELIIKPDCIYISALNKENVKRKYLNNKNQSYYYTKEAPMKITDIFNPSSYK